MIGTGQNSLLEQVLLDMHGRAVRRNLHVGKVLRQGDVTVALGVDQSTGFSHGAAGERVGGKASLGTMAFWEYSNNFSHCFLRDYP